ncbi:MAG: hypothetical protein KA236_13055 [Verrucomicrobia bacterium]|jgi:hypothetical protein|nr:hypothetical protein [Verrucomicrobiota bacterium]
MKNGLPLYVRTCKQLAAALGVSAMTISRHNRKPDAPRPVRGRHNVAAWRKYLLAYGRVLDSKDPCLAALKRQLICKQIEKLDFSIRRDKAELVSLATVKAWGAELEGHVRKIVSELHQLAPALAGLSVAEIAERLKAKEQDILRRLYSLAQRP